MKQVLLFLTLYAVFASACYYPFNNAQFANRTLLQEHIQDLKLDGALGWSSVVIGLHAPLQAWPANNARGSPMVTIFYCFPDDLARTHLEEYVNRAWEMWHNKIGDATKANGHRLKGIKEVTKDGQPVHCRLPGTQDWNPKVPPHTLEVKLQNPGIHMSETTTGFIRKSRPGMDYAGRHDMTIFEKSSRDLTLVDVAHELGHAFGLMHEHQRDDRDEYVHFDCTKLDYYDSWKQLVTNHLITNPDAPTIEQLCDADDNAMAYYGWMDPINWTTKLPDLWNMPQVQMHPSPYDYRSIMQYASFDPSRAGNDVTVPPMVRWKNGRPADGSKPHAQNAELIPYNTEVTDGDAEGIRALYTW